jgi:hypothetical protein
MTTIFNTTDALITKAVSRFANDEQLTADKLLLFISIFRALLPELYNRILSTLPENLLKEKNPTLEQRKAAFDEFLKNTDLSTHDDEKVPPSWTSMHWLSSIGMQRFLATIVSLDVNHHKPAVAELYTTVAQWSTHFGDTFAVRFLHPRFSAVFESEDSYHMKELIREAPDAGLSRFSPTYLVKERLLPAYFVGILCVVISHGAEMQKFVRERVRAIIVDVTQEKGSWSRSNLVLVERALELACKSSKDFLEMVLSLLHDDMMSDISKGTRVTVGSILGSLVNVVDITTLMQRVLPCVSTLVTDNENVVQLEALRALGTMTLNIDRDEDFDLVAAQYDQFFENREKNPEAYHQLLTIFAKIIPKVEPYFRDNYALKKLGEAGKVNNETEDKDERKAITQLLFECYRALNGCLLTREAIQSHILGGLEMLEVDAEAVNDTAIRNSVRGMLKDLRNAVKPKGIAPSPASMTPTSVPLSQIIGDVNIPNLQAAPPTPRNEGEEIGQKLKNLFSFGKK